MTTGKSCCDVHKSQTLVICPLDTQARSCFGVNEIKYCPLDHCDFVEIPRKVAAGSKLFVEVFVLLARQKAEFAKKLRSMPDGR